MRLWVIARAAAWQTVRRADAIYNDRGTRAEYAWLCAQMRRITGYSGPSVWWAWHQLDGVSGQAPTPEQCDQLHRCHPGTAMVCMEVEIPEREVMLADAVLWRQVCRRPDFLSFNAVEDAAMRARYTALSSAASEAIQLTWERIVTPRTWPKFDPAWLGGEAAPGQNLQATFAELRAADIVSVNQFESLKPSLRLIRTDAQPYAGSTSAEPTMPSELAS